MPKEKKTAAAPGKMEIGATVKFYLPNNKALELVGTLEEIEGDMGTVAVEPDGKIMEVPQEYSLPLRDLRLANEGDAHRHVGDRG